jgi:hypothetical protein
MQIWLKMHSGRMVEPIREIAFLAKIFVLAKNAQEPKATRRPRLGESSEARLHDSIEPGSPSSRKQP